jgi:hypothetical protein
MKGTCLRAVEVENVVILAMGTCQVLQKIGKSSSKTLQVMKQA